MRLSVPRRLGRHLLRELTGGGILRSKARSGKYGRPRVPTGSGPSAASIGGISSGIGAGICRLVLVMHSAPEHSDDWEYLPLFFSVDGWAGKPVIAEPEKCSELRWVDRSVHPHDLVDYVGEAPLAIERGESLALHGW